MSQDAHHDELHELLCRLSDTGLSPDDAARLQKLLESSPEARALYQDHLMLEAQLEFELGGTISREVKRQSEKVVALSNSAGKRSSRLRWVRYAAAVVLVAILFLSQITSVPQNTDFAARVVKCAGTEFDTAGPQLNAGDDVPAMAVTLAKGAIEIETNRQVRLIIEAPATFRFENSQKLVLKNGRIAAEVPPKGTGFTVQTPGGEVIDIGTKFGVDVMAGGTSEVHVFKGEVLAQNGDSTKRLNLRQDQALRMDAAGATPRDFRGAAFIQREEFQELAAGLRSGLQSNWAEGLKTLRRDPALLALPDFSLDPGKTCRQVQGRWPGTSAVEFTQPGDFFAMQLSGKSDMLTLATWVRLDQVPHAINSLIHADGWGQPGQVHWMVTESQRLRFAVFGAALTERDGRYPESSRQVTAAAGRWTHLVTVYDSTRRTVRFYLDGVFDNEATVFASVPVELGPSRLGNWNRKERILSGRLDELLILGRALSDTEVEALYRAGNPYGIESREKSK